jgi:UDP-N-acetylmuramoylalanine--D-glutamate ligase
MDLGNKKVTVLGAARSGIAAARLLNSKGAHVFVSDLGLPADFKDGFSLLKKSGIEFETGVHSDRVLEADFTVLSPGIPVSSDVVQKLYKRRIKVYSEIEIASWFNKSSVIGVTGSNGKTTTVTLIGEMLKKQNPEALVAGNIGQPFSEYVSNTKKGEWSVLELSSFQLETIDKFKPDISVILNFAPNHLDRYAGYDDYINAKWRITKNLTGKDMLIYNEDDEQLKARIKETDAQLFGFSTKSVNSNGAGFKDHKIYLYGKKLINTEQMPLKGIHNYMNAMAACLAASKSGISNDQIIDVLKQFSGVEHRLEKVTVYNGVTFINDSKSTTVESLMVALQSFENPVILIAGGKDKGSDFSRLNDLITKHVKGLVLIGTASNIMMDTWQKLKPAFVENSMQEAVQKAASLADKNEIVLLSPACASFDMFSNYEERGRIFKQSVLELKG